MSNLAPVFADGLKNKTVYGLFASKTAENSFRFICGVFKGEEVLGYHFSPPRQSAGYGATLLTEIKGRNRTRKNRRKAQHPKRVI